jgi:hypothetical protein
MMETLVERIQSNKKLNSILQLDALEKQINSVSIDIKTISTVY